MHAGMHVLGVLPATPSPSLRSGGDARAQQEPAPCCHTDPAKCTNASSAPSPPGIRPCNRRSAHVCTADRGGEEHCAVPHCVHAACTAPSSSCLPGCSSTTAGGCSSSTSCASHGSCSSVPQGGQVVQPGEWWPQQLQACPARAHPTFTATSDPAAAKPARRARGRRSTGLLLAPLCACPRSPPAHHPCAAPSQTVRTQLQCMRSTPCRVGTQTDMHL
jgi:hypothetical protein